MELLKLLDSKGFIERYTVLDNRTWDTGFYYKVRVYLQDASLFQASEYKQLTERVYSFHWQDAEGRLIIRWDNAPHHKHLSTYPHHKHLPSGVEESTAITLDEALLRIEAFLNSA